jgi:hypothetical protein
MRARVEMCRSKGFNAVDFDNVDAYTNDTGFHLTAAEQRAYDIFPGQYRAQPWPVGGAQE